MSAFIGLYLIPAVQLDGEAVPLPTMFTGNGSHIMLKLVGDSMVDAGIRGK